MNYTEEDVELVARAIWAVNRRSWPTLPETPIRECVVDARVVLDALAEAGRLLPAGGCVWVDGVEMFAGQPMATRYHLPSCPACKSGGSDG